MTATGNDVAAAFQQWQKAYMASNEQQGEPYLRFFADGSGSVWTSADQRVMGLAFNKFDEAVMVLNAAYDRLCPKIAVGDTIYDGARRFTVTNVFDSLRQPSVRADRANSAEPDFVIYVPLKHLKANSLRNWTLQ